MYYVYRHIRLDSNEVFYVGVGKQQIYTKNHTERTVYRRAYNRSSRNKLWLDIAKSTNYKVEILFTDMEYDVAIRKEVELILLYGRVSLDSGTLCNLSSGGCNKDYNIGSEWYTDGQNQARVSKGDTPPNGFYKGCSKSTSDTKRGLSNPNFKGWWITPKGVFESSRDAAKALGVSKSTVSAKCLGGVYQYYKGKRYWQDRIEPQYSFINKENFAD